MNIGLCDDNNTDIINLKNFIKSFCVQKEIDVNINCFSCGEELLKATKQTHYDILFVDIYMNGISGIDMVKSIRKSENCCVVFTTSSREHAVEAFSLNAMHYLVKPITANDVTVAMQRCLNFSNNEANKIIEIKSGQGIIPVSLSSIEYIEVSNKVSIVHTVTSTLKNDIPTHTPLDSIFEMLDSDFFMKAQRSFVLNMNYIDSFFPDHVVMKNGVEITLSRSNKSMLKNQYEQFLFKLARGRVL